MKYCISCKYNQQFCENNSKKKKISTETSEFVKQIQRNWLHLFVFIFSKMLAGKKF